MSSYNLRTSVFFKFSPASTEVRFLDDEGAAFEPRTFDRSISALSSIWASFTEARDGMRQPM